VSEALLEYLHHNRRSRHLRFADQHMKVLRHEHEAEHDKAMASPDFFQEFEQQIAVVRGAQQRTSPVTTASDKVQIVGAVITLEAARYDRGMTSWILRSL